MDKLREELERDWETNTKLVNSHTRSQHFAMSEISRYAMSALNGVISDGSQDKELNVELSWEYAELMVLAEAEHRSKASKNRDVLRKRLKR